MCHPKKSAPGEQKIGKGNVRTSARHEPRDPLPSRTRAQRPGVKNRRPPRSPFHMATTLFSLLRANPRPRAAGSPLYAPRFSSACDSNPRGDRFPGPPHAPLLSPRSPPATSTRALPSSRAASRPGQALQTPAPRHGAATPAGPFFPERTNRIPRPDPVRNPNLPPGHSGSSPSPTPPSPFAPARAPDLPRQIALLHRETQSPALEAAALDGQPHAPELTPTRRDPRLTRNMFPPLPHLLRFENFRKRSRKETPSKIIMALVREIPRGVARCPTVCALGGRTPVSSGRSPVFSILPYIQLRSLEHWWGSGVRGRLDRPPYYYVW